MATEQAAMSMNGTYAAHNGQAFVQNYASHNANATSYSATHQAASSPQPTTSNSAADIPKDEVGWYFVEQYYTTLSRSSDKLHLFYNKRSQFVSGVEEEKVEVSVGQKAINDRIMQQDFKDCKVRVTNVDSQGSDSNIVIQVIGEISNRNQPHRKFIQTFVLGAQTNGYFVLNDIFRYIKEEEGEPEEEPQNHEQIDQGLIEEDVGPDATTTSSTSYEEPNSSIQKPVAEVLSHGTVSEEVNLVDADNKLEDIQEGEAVRSVSPPPARTAGTPVPGATEVVQADEAPIVAVSTAETPSPEQAAILAAEEAAQPEKPADPAPTPAPTPAPETAKAAQAISPQPMSWAMKAASANKSAPAAQTVPPVPAQNAASKTPIVQNRSTHAPVSVPAAASVATPRGMDSIPTADHQQDGWQTAEHTRRQSRNQPPEPTLVHATITNIYEDISIDALKKTLSEYGIMNPVINRPKSTAHVYFANRDDLGKALTKNPHTINGHEVCVQESRSPSNRYQRYSSRGGSTSRGRGSSERTSQGQGRGGGGSGGGFHKDGGRGGFAPRGRGGAPASRRGGSTVA